ncbi:MAG TPA: hypothetical protein VFY29_11855 [Terriglobia bacterium]|nr:hypothetical protein [Terriglobia bacterium]
MSSAWILVIPVSALAALWMRDRKQLTAQIETLSRQQEKTGRALSQFIEESEKIMREFSRLLPESAPAPVAPADPKLDTVEKRHMVWRLSAKGHSAAEIADRLMMPAGEVQLMLNLDPGKRRKLTA